MNNCSNDPDDCSAENTARKVNRLRNEISDARPDPGPLIEKPGVEDSPKIARLKSIMSSGEVSLAEKERDSERWMMEAEYIADSNPFSPLANFDDRKAGTKIPVLIRRPGSVPLVGELEISEMDSGDSFQGATEGGEAEAEKPDDEAEFTPDYIERRQKQLGMEGSDSRWPHGGSPLSFLEGVENTNHDPLNLRGDGADDVANSKPYDRAPLFEPVHAGQKAGSKDNKDRNGSREVETGSRVRKLFLRTKDWPGDCSIQGINLCKSERGFPIALIPARIVEGGLEIEVLEQDWENLRNGKLYADFSIVTSGGKKNG